MEETVFSKIIRKEIPAKIVYEDEQSLAFWDIDPKAPVHILIIPKKQIPTVNDVKFEDEQLIGHLFVVAAVIAKDEGIAEDGYRLVVNCRSHAGQTVWHLHMHLLGGKKLGEIKTIV